MFAGERSCRGAVAVALPPSDGGVRPLRAAPPIRTRGMWALRLARRADHGPDQPQRAGRTPPMTPPAAGSRPAGAGRGPDDARRRSYRARPDTRPARIQHRPRRDLLPHASTISRKYRPSGLCRRERRSTCRPGRWNAEGAQIRRQSPRYPHWATCRSSSPAHRGRDGYR